MAQNVTVAGENHLQSQRLHQMPLKEKCVGQVCVCLVEVMVSH